MIMLSQLAIYMSTRFKLLVLEENVGIPRLCSLYWFGFAFLYKALRELL